jgi:hypothetical protein
MMRERVLAKSGDGKSSDTIAVPSSVPRAAEMSERRFLSFFFCYFP